jgi:hypothetical protein
VNKADDEAFKNIAVREAGLVLERCAAALYAHQTRCWRFRLLKLACRECVSLEMRLHEELRNFCVSARNILL